MPDLGLLKTVSFGSRVAEDESDLLESYFVETSQWGRIASGEVDIVYGPKGSGKSALYSLLLKRSSEFFDRNVLLVPAENPRGAAAFQGIEHDPPTTEIEFVSMWKLYFVVLLAHALDEYDVENTASMDLISRLRDAGLVGGARGLQAIVRAVVDYVRRVKSLEGNLQFDTNTGAPVIGGKIALGEPSSEQRSLGVRSIDDLVRLADDAWRDSEYKVWLILDRLDVAFADNTELEENALRALFKTYLDFNDRESFRLKIFLRSDIWGRLAAKGFREASHITRQTTIEWDKQSLLNLIVNRTLGNESVRRHFGIADADLPKTYEERVNVFERAFPETIDLGSKKSDTIDWILGRTRDGTGASAPREIIHLLTAARDSQIKLLENGETDDGSYVIGRAPFKIGLQEVSKVRLEQTIYAEYPKLKERIAQLESEKASQRPETLAEIWNVSRDEARDIASELVEIGLFEPRGTKPDPQYWVPFLYRDALKLVQGAATVTGGDDGGVDDQEDA